MSFIRTFTGKRFYPLDPKAEDIDINDIAHSLSNLCRFAGHCSSFYSVAQHSVIVSEVLRDRFLASPALQLKGLLHDATEAYLVDIPRPVKVSNLMAGYRSAEANLELKVAEKFGLGDIMTTEVKYADMVALVTEARDLMGDPKDWSGFENIVPTIAHILPKDPFYAKRMFIEKYLELTNAQQK
jgi:5'-deoxynucleotidase YfbR-like HD superfamily hydrolase